LVQWPKLCTLIKNETTFFFICVVTPIFAPWNTLLPSKPIEMNLVPNFSTFKPPNVIMATNIKWKMFSIVPYTPTFFTIVELFPTLNNIQMQRNPRYIVYCNNLTYINKYEICSKTNIMNGFQQKFIHELNYAAPCKIISIFLGLCLTLSIVKRSYKPLEFIIVQPLNNQL